MRSPCLECHLLGSSKENDECFNCKKRLAYVAYIGSAEHSIPVAQFIPKRIDEGVKMESTVENGVFRPYTDHLMNSTPKTKTCRTCHKVKSLEDDFSRSAKSPDGYMHICKECHAETIGKSAAEKQPKRPVGRPPKSASDAKITEKAPSPPPLTHKRCRECKCVKPVEEFLANTLTRDGYSHICKACWKTANRRPVSESRPIIRIDFTDHQEALQELKNHADRELRTPEMHALYILKKTLTSTAAR